jgi:hypothetical protein
MDTENVAKMNRLRQRKKELTEELRKATNEIIESERKCPHDWSKPKYEQVYIPGYDIAGDVPGTMGVDFRHGFHVNSEYKDKWTRTCANCGLIQETEKSEVLPGPKAPVFR